MTRSSALFIPRKDFDQYQLHPTVMFKLTRLIGLRLKNQSRVEDLVFRDVPPASPIYL